MQELRQASVAIPFYRDEKGNLRLVLIKRSNYGQHGSQISLPGGNREPHDEGAWDTALREIIEELGLSTKQIVLLSQLEPIDTHITRYGTAEGLVDSWG